jgi:hypothetical protein
MCVALAQRVRLSFAGMSFFSTSEPWRETSESGARPSAVGFSDALRQRLLAVPVFISAMFVIGGCGYAGTPPKPSVGVSVQPTSALVALGATQQFQATVTGSTDDTVEWDVNGVANGNAISGTVSGAGLYTAPAVMPSSASVTVTAISQVNPGDHASAIITLQAVAVTVMVQPASALVTLGATQQFQATVSGSTDTAVTWEVNGLANGNAVSGTVSAAGLYTAPLVMPASTNVTVTAISQVNPGDQASAIVTLQPGIGVSVLPATATVAPGGAQIFTASISGSDSLAGGVAWSVNGVAGGDATLGTIVVNSLTSAVYTAPNAIPSPATATVTAASVADPTKAGSASVTIACAVPNAIAPLNAQVALGQLQTFTATFCGAAGAQVAWDVNGISGGNSAVGTIVVTGLASASYTAPPNLPTTNLVTVHATEGGTILAAAITVVSNVTVSVLPVSASIATGQRVTLTPTVINTSDTSVTWIVNGIANGNAAAGQICQRASNPCLAPDSAGPGSIDYVAPATAPTSNPVTVIAISAADASKSASALITISGVHESVVVNISPAYAFVAPSGGAPSMQQFFTTVTGTTNTNVSWSVQSGGGGQGCSGTACGSINSAGLYTAPTAAPSPNAVTVTATSQANSSDSASATVAITSGPTIEVILPSSVFAGAVESFPLQVQGSGFVAGSGSAASAISINGVTRGTTCAAVTSCATGLNPADVQSAGTLTIQVQNPGPNGALSNPVPFVIAPFDISVGTIALSSDEPAATPIVLTVPEPTTAAESAAIDVDTIGLLTGGNNCGIQGSPLTVTRPVSGSAVVSLCIHGNLLDPTFAYSFSGAGGVPGGSDIIVTASAVTGLFPNTIELDLQISSATLPGVRTLFITTLNNDRAASTGMLEVR